MHWYTTTETHEWFLGLSSHSPGWQKEKKNYKDDQSQLVLTILSLAEAASAR